MNPINRREFLQTALATGAVASSTSALSAAVARASTPAGSLRVATFRFEVTPPKGHSLCGGWIKPASEVDDPLEAIGYILLGAGRPIVFCVVDWTGILNEAHRQWRVVLAEAAGTTPDRVSVHCVHQHNAPLVCFEAGRLLEGQPDLPRVFEMDFFQRCLDRARAAVTTAMERSRPVTHVGQGAAPVVQVAANRRMARDAGGRVTAMRGSSCKDPALIAMPEGPIDPLLRTIAFYDGDTKILACHYYATHPMSYYGDGRVSSDFCGLARRRRERDEPGCTHIYFTGCAGNIAAGKYNDGTPASRVRLTNRIYEGIVASEAALRREPVGTVEWRTRDVLPAINPAIAVDALQELITKQKDSVVFRMRPAFKLSYLRRCARKEPLVLGALHLNDVASLYLPSEPFIEYQLRAQTMGKRSVAVAGYGDNGPWYIPTKGEYPFGGYEVDYAFSSAEIDDAFVSAMRELLG
ncbi:hypothetical protein [Horticoccus sp. 23ND18S-11]|uniref:hypothetical protein n=1 Tax=Horticoccus sp. 23ND18S-11 TaxID=3391832 RepID=UPI0039C9646D